MYEVLLSNNFEIDFDTARYHIDIDGNNQATPDALIPAKIKTYITDNYLTQIGTKINREKTQIEIELLNDTDLIFDLEGNFISINNTG